MSIDISHETEALLTAEAEKRGVSVATLLARLINECATRTPPARPDTALPVWRLGGAGDLHRRDIYSDVG